MNMLVDKRLQTYPETAYMGKFQGKQVLFMQVWSKVASL